MPDYDRFLDFLATEDIGDVRRDEPLREHSTLRIGGPAALFVEPRCREHLCLVLRHTANAKIPALVIGDGSNLLFDDAGFRGVVIRIGRHLSAVTIEGTYIRAEAGVWVPRFARAVGRAGLAGLEHVVGIPGTLGGLIVMNGGSQRNNVGEVVRRVWAVDAQGRPHNLSQQDCAFSYRRSSLQGSGLIVVKAEMECRRGDPSHIRARMLDILRNRRRKFPLKSPNCGSVFISHPEIYDTFGPPGKLIEDAGLKGLRVGDAQVSHQHANFIVNLGQASASDVLELIRRVRETVYQRMQIWMECEVRHVAPTGQIRPAHEVL